MKRNLKYLQLFENRSKSLKRLVELGLEDKNLPQEIRDYLAGPGTDDLDLRGTEIRELPAGLEVGGSLALSYTRIKSLPAGLRIGGSLYLNGTRIKELPADLQVGGKIHGFKG
jgi:hypothetical protein